MCRVYLNVSYFSVYTYFNTLVIGNYYSESCSVMSDYLWPHRLYSPWNSAAGMGSLSLLQGIFPTQGSNPGLPHSMWILYQLSHQRIPRILEWIAYPFSRGSSWPINQTEVSCIAGRSFTNWAIREDFRLFLTTDCTIFNIKSSYYIFSKYISQKERQEKLGRKRDANV